MIEVWLFNSFSIPFQTMQLSVRSCLCFIKFLTQREGPRLSLYRAHVDHNACTHTHTHTIHKPTIEIGSQATVYTDREKNASLFGGCVDISVQMFVSRRDSLPKHRIFFKKEREKKQSSRCDMPILLLNKAGFLTDFLYLPIRNNSVQS